MSKSEDDSTENYFYSGGALIYTKGSTGLMGKPEIEPNRRQPMKLVWTTLAGLYLSLTLIIASWILIFVDNPKWVSWSLLVLIIVLGLCNFALGIANIVAASKLYNNNEYYVLRVRMKLIKLASIPYFIVNFIFNFLFFMVLFGASRGLIILTPIPMLMIIPIALTYLSVLFTSTYGIGFILKLRNNRISTGRAIVHIILQVFFVLDIVDTIILIIKHKAKKPDHSFKKVLAQES